MDNLKGDKEVEETGQPKVDKLIRKDDDGGKVDGEQLNGENDQQVVNQAENPAKEPEVNKEEKHIMSLDEYSLLMIFDQLTVRDRARCSLVNRRWYCLMQDCWAASTQLSFKESFSLWGDQSLTSIILNQILRKCPLLKQLDLCQTATTLDDKTCGIIGRCCPRLEKLVLRDANLNKYSVIAIGKFCPNLTSVDFGRCNNITEKSLWGLLYLRNRMEELSLSNIVHITGRCFYLCRNLRYLDLSGCCSVVADSFQRLAQHCSQILQVLIAPPLTVTGFNFICKTFPNLVRFEVDSPAAGFPVLAGASSLGLLTKLETLIFRPELIDLCDETFHHITAKLPNLVELNIFGTDRITDLSTIALPDHCPKLKTLHLEGFNFGDNSLKCFAQFKHLEQLTVSGSLITDDGAYHIMTHLPNLELLGVNSCLGISLQTLTNAYELVSEGLANKNLLICYNNCRIKICEFKEKSDIRRYESKDIWGSDQEYFDYRDCDEYNNDDDDERSPNDHFYYPDDNDDDDYIADGDFDFEEEELS